MITTTVHYACDVEGCGSSAETKDVMSMGFGGIPKGWAMLNWIAEVMPDGHEKSDVMRRFKRAFSKLKAKMPPEVAEYNEAAQQLFVGDQLAQPQPRQVSCKAVVCDRCLDRFNLGSFDAEGGSGLLSV